MFSPESRLRKLAKKHPQVFGRIVFENQSKGVAIDNYKFAFYDSNGIEYKEIATDDKMSLDRYGYLQLTVMELNRCMGGKEVTLIVEAIQKSITEITEAKDSKITTKQLHNIWEIGEEIKRRDKYFIQPDLYWDLVSHLYLRADEDPKLFNFQIHKEKQAQFRKDADTGLYDFFFLTRLSEFLPLLKELDRAFLKLLDLSQAKTNEFHQYLRDQNLLTSESPSAS
jgi:hypothetical protein